VLHRADLVELPVSVSSGYRARRVLESAAGAARPGLFASSTNNAEPSPPLACRRTAVSADVRELAAPMPMSLTTGYQGSSSAVTNDLHFKIQYEKCYKGLQIKKYSILFQLQIDIL